MKVFTSDRHADKGIGMVRVITYREAVREAIREEMARDESVVMFGEDVARHGGAFAVSQGLLEEFGPGRIIDTPISEIAIAGMGVGASLTGLRPIAEIMYSDFCACAMDQIVNQMAKNRYMFGGKARLPIVLRTAGGGGRSNAAQHSQSLEAWFAHVPGLIVVMPSTPYDAKGLLKTCIRNDNPIIFLEHKLLYNVQGEVPEAEYFVPLGKSVVKREGEDVTLIATSRMTLTALEAAEKLQEKGVSCEVIDPISIRPLDIETIMESVKKTGRAVIVHEASRFGGIGAEIAAEIQEYGFDYLDSPIVRIGALECPIPYNRRLEQHVLPSTEGIERRVTEMLQ